MKNDASVETWSDALRLYERICTFVGVAPREHDEWWFDVAVIMRLETPDPRGWESIDPHEGEDERRDDRKGFESRPASEARGGCCNRALPECADPARGLEISWPAV
ncbi:hypothetical protein [Streptomyces sp. NPDC002187]|uniref:hypothetical protein n=1 Tax=Streptomyces sp. NPDC002187 TaxID=3364637 RepID=UPI00368419B5